MASALQSTMWPPITVPDPTRTLIARFLHLVDLKDSESGALLAKEIFTADGHLGSAAGVFNGFHGEYASFRLCSQNRTSLTVSSPEISTSRTKAWDTVYYRCHN